MKIKILMKNPDCVYDSINDAIEESLKDLESKISESEYDALKEERRENLDLSKWIEFGEYIQIEIDTDTDTAIVVPFK